MKDFTVELRIHGANLDPSKMTKTLGLKPTTTRNVGDRRDSDKCWEEAMWSYNGSEEVSGVVSWPSLEEGLDFVIQKLWPLRKLLEEYKREYDIILWCGHFSSICNSSFVLSPEILAKLGEFRIQVFIDTYFSVGE